MGSHSKDFTIQVKKINKFYFKYRSDNDIKNHFHSNLKKMFRKLLKKKLDISN
jgi:hypothetical protein